MNGRNWVIGAICAALLPLAALAQGGGGPGHFHGDFRGGGEGMLLKGLSLTSDQQTAIEGIHQAARAQGKPLAMQLHQIRTAMRSAFLATGALNSEKLASLQTQASTIRGQLDQLHLTTMMQIRGVLTPAQVAQAASTASQLQSLHQQERALMHPDGPDSESEQ